MLLLDADHAANLADEKSTAELGYVCAKISRSSTVGSDPVMRWL